MHKSIYEAWVEYHGGFPKGFSQQLEQLLCSTFVCGAAVVLAVCTRKEDPSEEEARQMGKALCHMRDELDKYIGETMLTVMTGEGPPIITELKEAPPPAPPTHDMPGVVQ